jgi:hypothetical protein
VLRIDTSNPRRYLAARAAACAHAVQGQIREFGGSVVDRTAFIVVRLTNSTDRDITVTSQRLVYGATVWDQASVVVPPRGQAELRIEGTGVSDGPTPCTERLVIAAGEPIYDPHGRCGVG